MASFMENYGGVDINTSRRQGHNDEETNDSAATDGHRVERSSWRKKVDCILKTHYRRTFGVSLIIIVITAISTVLYHYIWTYIYPPGSSKALDNGEEEQCLSDRNWPTALLISVFFGSLGADRFYLGYTLLGTLKAFTEGFYGIWWTIDVVLILLNEVNDYPNGCRLRDEMGTKVYSFFKENSQLELG